MNFRHFDFDMENPELEYAIIRRSALCRIYTNHYESLDPSLKVTTKDGSHNHMGGELAVRYWFSNASEVLLTIVVPNDSNFDVQDNLLTYIDLGMEYEWVYSNPPFICILIRTTIAHFNHKDKIFQVLNVSTNREVMISFDSKCQLEVPPSLNKNNGIVNFINCIYPNSRPKYVAPEKLDQFINYCVQTGFFQFRGTQGHLEDFEAEEVELIIGTPPDYDDNEYRVLLFDVETSDFADNLNASISDTEYWPYIVSIAWKQLRYSDDYVYDSQSYVLEPKGFLIMESAIAFHGITNEFAKDEGCPRIPVLKYLSEILSASDIVVAHNTEFDLNVLRCEFYRNGIDDPMDDLVQIDTMKASAEEVGIKGSKGGLKTGGFKWPTLTELYEHLFDRPPTKVHSAEADVESLTEAFLELVDRGVIDIEAELDQTTNQGASYLDDNDLPNPSPGKEYENDLPF